ncbi:MAG: hypothetical protein IH991_16930 [Planctomycetes bacterium]|nr:hypothetical protein [Planctomycetota bacterium]
MSRTFVMVAVGAVMLTAALKPRPSTAADVYNASYSELVASIEAQNEAIESQHHQISRLLEQNSQFLGQGKLPDYGCKSCCSDPCCCPGWTITADALFMDRSRPDANVLARAAGFIPILNASDLGFGFEVGPRVSAIRHFDTCCDIEIGYFQIDGWSAAANFPIGAFLDLPNNFGVFITDMEYTSRLYNGELNARTACWRGLDLLLGFRWMELNERLTALVSNLIRYTGDTNNHLYGLQVGAVLTPLDTGRLQVLFSVKAGAFHNNADSSSTLAGNRSASDRQHDLAFVGEISITGVCQLTDRLRARAGYQLMLLDSVALATDQLATYDSIAGTATLNLSGSLLYHGGFAGLELIW